jgi:hypothetical protein
MPKFDGADVSHYQDEAGALINWDALFAASGGSYAATKASQRHNYIDPTLARHRSEMRRCKFRRRPLYHWQSPIAEASVQLQLANWNRAVGDLEVGEADMLDAEQSGITEPEAVYLLEGREERTQRPCIVYNGIFVAGGTIFRSNRIRESKYGERGIHLAAYTSEARLQQLLATQGLTGYPYHLWQYSSNGPVSGVVGRCDMNQIINAAVLDNCCGYNQVQEEVMKPIFVTTGDGGIWLCVPGICLIPFVGVADAQAIGRAYGINPDTDTVTISQDQFDRFHASTETGGQAGLSGLIDLTIPAHQATGVIHP